MAEDVSAEDFLRQMNKAMPPEMQLKTARVIDDRHPAPMASLKAGMYEIQIRDKKQASELISAIGPMMSRKEIWVSRKTKSGIREVDMKPLIYSLHGEENTLFTTLMISSLWVVGRHSTIVA